MNKHNYDRTKSLNTFEYDYLSVNEIWTQMDIQKFRIGLAKSGKNFFQIRKEYVSFGCFFKVILDFMKKLFFLK